MARSGYVYIVLAGDEPAAAFTVKHELRDWLMQVQSASALKLWRMRDGCDLIAVPPVAMDIQAVIEGR